MTFRAQWKINQYTATFDFKREGTGYDNNNIVKRTQNYGTELVKPVPTWPGRELVGWYRDGDSSETTVDVPATMPAENVRYNGKWAWETHYVYYKYADTATFGTDNIGNPQTVSDGTVPAKPTPPTHSGYEFKQWVGPEPLTGLDADGKLVGDITWFALYAASAQPTQGYFNGAREYGTSTMLSVSATLNAGNKYNIIFDDMHFCHGHNANHLLGAEFSVSDNVNLVSRVICDEYGNQSTLNDSQALKCGYNGVVGSDTENSVYPKTYSGWDNTRKWWSASSVAVGPYHGVGNGGVKFILTTDTI